ncbi:hypothetical protein M011DRAFT_514180 [Sporormia fimetaria CBS 119925]|uniref:Uncharacterized protein n=1 Tax=Sporormia fimetaria CBS 119925 TaxID=1340428 RepID=A0A6A6UTW2_9PLEO|nr:hypothetical protein M011DRAFT_514180 [Sporormia fimetaria CBS 119925]
MSHERNTLSQIHARNSEQLPIYTHPGSADAPQAVYPPPFMTVPIGGVQPQLIQDAPAPRPIGRLPIMDCVQAQLLHDAPQAVYPAPQMIGGKLPMVDCLQPQDVQRQHPEWPSQIAHQSSHPETATHPASAAVALLQTEIQSHHVTREMLHSTEQRRLQAEQACTRLESDCYAWAAAYNSLTAALQHCSKEYSRVANEILTLVDRTHSGQPEASLNVDSTDTSLTLIQGLGPAPK